MKGSPVRIRASASRERRKPQVYLTAMSGAETAAAGLTDYPLSRRASSEDRPLTRLQPDDPELGARLSAYGDVLETSFSKVAKQRILRECAHLEAALGLLSVENRFLKYLPAPVNRSIDENRTGVEIKDLVLVEIGIVLLRSLIQRARDGNDQEAARLEKAKGILEGAPNRRRYVLEYI